MLHSLNGAYIGLSLFLYYRAKARDDDFTEKFNTISYWIHPSSDHFLINPLNGDIYLTTPLDYETTTIYEIMVSIELRNDKLQFLKSFSFVNQ